MGEVGNVVTQPWKFVDNMSDNTIFDIFPIMGNGEHLFMPFSPKWFYILEVGPFSKKNM